MVFKSSLYDYSYLLYIIIYKTHQQQKMLTANFILFLVIYIICKIKNLKILLNNLFF